jgi:hypothetical protein
MKLILIPMFVLFLCSLATAGWWDTTTADFNIDSFNRANQNGWGTADSGSDWVDEIGSGNCIISGNTGYFSGRANDCTIKLSNLGNTYYNSISFSILGSALTRDGDVTFYNGTTKIMTISFRSGGLVKYGPWASSTTYSSYSTSYRTYSIEFDPTNDTVRLGRGTDDTGWIPAMNAFENVDKIRVNGENVGANNGDFQIDWFTGNVTTIGGGGGATFCGSYSGEGDWTIIADTNCIDERFGMKGNIYINGAYKLQLTNTKIVNMSGRFIMGNAGARIMGDSTSALL